MSIEALQPFLPQGMNPAQPLQANQPIQSGQKFAAELQKAQKPVEFDLESLDKDISSNNFGEIQNQQTSKPFSPESVSKVADEQALIQESLSLDSLNSKAHSRLYIQGANKVQSSAESFLEDEPLHVSKEAAEFRRKKLTTAYSKLNRYRNSSNVIYG